MFSLIGVQCVCSCVAIIFKSKSCCVHVCCDLRFHRDDMMHSVCQFQRITFSTAFPWYLNFHSFELWGRRRIKIEKVRRSWVVTMYRRWDKNMYEIKLRPSVVFWLNWIICMIQCNVNLSIIGDPFIHSLKFGSVNFEIARGLLFLNLDGKYY